MLPTGHVQCVLDDVAKRLLGIMKDSSIQEGSERSERPRSTKLFVEKSIV